MHRIIILLSAMAVFPSLASGSLVFFGMDSSDTIIEIQPNMANQDIMIFSSGSTVVSGMNLRLIIGDGGIDISGMDVGAPAAGANTPGITNVDVLTDTIFGDAGGTQSGDFGGSATMGDTGADLDYVLAGSNASLLGAITSVTANGKLATITIDTTGITSGDFPIGFQEPGEFTTDFAGIAACGLQGATLRVVPEPSAFLAIGLVIVFAVGQRRWITVEP
ncbi:MAG: hypothetical protein AAF497_00720 [Planctomycetota bacterium]